MSEVFGAGVATANKIRHNPEGLFAAFAIGFGLLFVVLIPPLGGGNETFNFGRVVGIANGAYLVGEVAVPAGLAEFMAAGAARFPAGLQPPFAYTARDVRALAEIPLHRAGATDIVIPPNPIGVLNPVSYVPQVAVVRLGAWFGMRPLILFDLARMAGLGAAIGLTILAIRRMPTHKYLLCALALLPPITFSRSTVDANQITDAFAFLFIASLLREIRERDRMRVGGLMRLSLMSFVMAQCKSAYFVLPFLVLAVPGSRFTTPRARVMWCLAAIVPGTIADFAYMLALKNAYFAHVAYQTWAGRVDPTRQLVDVLEHPLKFAAILARTVFTTDFVPQAVRGVFSVFGPPVELHPSVWICVAALLLGLIACDPTSRATPYDRRTQFLAAAIFVGGTAFILTLLYLQWTGYRADTIEGFQGHYLYPLLPLLVVFLPSTRPAIFSLQAGTLVLGLAGLGLVSTAWLTVLTYFG